MPLDLAVDLAHALDPVAFVQDRLKFEPDPWQASLLRSRARWILLNCCRQSGKSTTTAAVALHTAIYDPGLILLVSPSLRQSKSCSQRSPASSRISSRPRCSKRTTRAVALWRTGRA